MCLGWSGHVVSGQGTNIKSCEDNGNNLVRCMCIFYQSVFRRAPGSLWNLEPSHMFKWGTPPYRGGAIMHTKTLSSSGGRFKHGVAWCVEAICMNNLSMVTPLEICVAILKRCSGARGWRRCRDRGVRARPGRSPTPQILHPNNNMYMSAEEYMNENNSYTMQNWVILTLCFQDNLGFTVSGIWFLRLWNCCFRKSKHPWPYAGIWACQMICEIRDKCLACAGVPDGLFAPERNCACHWYREDHPCALAAEIVHICP